MYDSPLHNNVDMGKRAREGKTARRWLLVLPEYVLNVGATRYGYGTYTGAQMASFHLSFGVVAVALVARFVLGERLTALQWAGFALLAVATLLITWRKD